MSEPRIIDRIRKLLRLARSDNVHEAATAAARAQELMSKYELEEAQLGDISEDNTSRVMAFADEDGLYGANRLALWLLRLAVNLAELNNAECFVQVKGKRRVIGLVGNPRNVSLIRYLFLFLKREIERLCSVHAQGRSSTQWRNSFKLGATDEVILRMREARDSIFRTASHTALARINAERLEARNWVEEKQTRKPRKPKADVAYHAYVTGRVVGRQIQLDTELELPEPTQQLEEHCR